jgi:Rrf2 family protein
VISRSSEYAIRALTYLAQQRDGRHRLARDIAEQLGIPAPFLGKVLQPLVSRGILHSQRGRSGGFRLDRPASAIALVDIVETQEDVGTADVCMLGQRVCDDAHACPLHDTWTKAANAFHARLRGTSLQDVVDFCEAHPGCPYPFQATPPQVGGSRGRAVPA